MNKNCIIDVNNVIESGLGLEAYLILYCVKTNNNNLISSYTRKCKKINTEIFKDLEAKGLLNIKWNDSNQIHFSLLSLTSRADELLQPYVLAKSVDSVKTIDENLEKQFGEFLTIYPKSVKDGLTTRRLHGNLSKCKKLYEKLLMETTHDVLCKAAKLYVEEKYRSRSQMFIQALETWLNQKNYQQYLEDIEKISNFTINDNPTFTDDI